MRTFAFFLFSIIGIACYSQEKTISNSTFDKNDGWGLIDDENATFSVDEGYYKLNHKRTTSGWSAYKSVGIEPEKDFYVEAKIIHKEGVSNYKYGIFLKDQRRSKKIKQHYFSISANHFFIVYSYDFETEKTTNHQEWKEMKNLVNGETDVLAIQKKGNETIFYINETEVFRTEVEFYGNNIGVILDNNQTIWVDYILVKQDKEDIVLADGYDIPYALENLGDNINSKYDDLTPVISTDEKTLYVSRKQHPENTGTDKNDDIWFSTKNDDGTWAPLKNIGTPLNNDGHNFVISVSPDNNTLFIANTYYPDGRSKSSGLSVTNRTTDGWEVPSEIVIEDYYNDNKYVDYCFSPNRKVLVMSVERNDTYGEKDLYVSFNTGVNRYSSPVNMGSEINSFAAENSPFIAADNTTLYYSSAGKPGYGGSDIFMVRRLDESWTKWSVPQNMGPKINSTRSELTYTIPASGNFAYMVSNMEEGKKGDIYKIKVPESAKPNPVVLIKGKVLNSKTKEPLTADIVYLNLSSNTEVGNASSNPSTGEYQIVLPFGVNYGFSARKEGFYPISENIDVTKLDKYTEIERNLYLTPLEKGVNIRMNNIFFDFNKAALLPESYNELDNLIQFLSGNPGLAIEISGHTDNVGSDDYNMNLSQKRADVVVKYLTEKGVKNKLTAKGYGKIRPVASNETDEGKRQNRRVEFTIAN